MLLGTFTANKTWAATGMVGYFPMPKLMGAISASAVILAAMYLLTMYQKLMFGPLDKPENKAVRDIHGRETWVFGIIVVAALVMGIAPQPILSRSEKSVNAFITGYRDRLQDARRAPEAPRTSIRRCRPRDGRPRPRHGRRPAAPRPSRPEASRNELRFVPDLRLHAAADPDRHGLRRPARRDVRRAARAAPVSPGWASPPASSRWSRW